MTKTKRWFKDRIAYYPNSVAAFHFNALMISIYGDVHPLPGPINRSTCKILVRCTDRKKKRRRVALAHVMNCIKINSTRSNLSSLTLSHSLDLCFWNARSVKNKALSLKDYTVEHDLDFLALTETWLHSGESDKFFVGELSERIYFPSYSQRELKRRWSWYAS